MVSCTKGRAQSGLLVQGHPSTCTFQQAPITGPGQVPSPVEQNRDPALHLRMTALPPPSHPARTRAADRRDGALGPELSGHARARAGAGRAARAPSLSPALGAADMAVRFLLATLLLLPFYGRDLLTISRREWSQAGGAGLLRRRGHLPADGRAPLDRRLGFRLPHAALHRSSFPSSSPAAIVAGPRCASSQPV